MKQPLGVNFLRGWWNKPANDMALWFKGELSSLNISKKEPTVWELEELQSPADEEETKLRLPFSSWQNGNAVWNIEEELTRYSQKNGHHPGAEDWRPSLPWKGPVSCWSLQHLPERPKVPQYASGAGCLPLKTRLTRQCNLKELTVWCEFFL